MDFLITDDELTALCGLPYIQQLAYLRGVRPYMDVKTSLVGIKRGISYQSIAEQLYIEPHQGIAGGSPSRQQLRRAISGLERAGLINVQSSDKQLILKCELASRGFPVQNKADTNPTPHADTFIDSKKHDSSIGYGNLNQKADIGKTPKADTPLKDNNFIYLLSQFEEFWNLYPEKKSKQQACEAFQLINPNKALFNSMLHALDLQIKHRNEKQVNGLWVPPWMFPANWLTQRRWEDELTVNTQQEKHHATGRKNSGSESPKDLFWSGCESEDDKPANNVVPFQRCK